MWMSCQDGLKPFCVTVNLNWPQKNKHLVRVPLKCFGVNTSKYLLWPHLGPTVFDGNCLLKRDLESLVRNSAQDSFNGTSPTNKQLRVRIKKVIDQINQINRGVSPLPRQLPFLPPGGKGLKLISIRGPSWCLIRSGLIPEPNGEESKPITTLPLINVPLLTEGLSQPSSTGHQPLSERRDVKRVGWRGKDAKMGGKKKRKSWQLPFSPTTSVRRRIQDFCEEFQVGLAK